MQSRLFSTLSLSLLSSLGCVAATEAPDELGTAAGAIASEGAWYHLDAASGVGAATLTVVNGYEVRCPNGSWSRTCEVSSLVLPPDCGWECQDGLLSMQGEGLLRGRFDGEAFVVAAGLDTWAPGLGSRSIYQITAAPTCDRDPCPGALFARKLNRAGAPVAVTRVDFSHAVDTNYVLDPTRGDDQAASAAGLLVSGRVVSHVFRADRVWRLQTPRPACEPQLVARAHAYRGDAPDVVQLRTVAEAERAVAPDGGSVAWLVRTAESPTQVSFTSGINDLWVERFDVAKSDCALTVTGEH